MADCSRQGDIGEAVAAAAIGQSGGGGGGGGEGDGERAWTVTINGRGASAAERPPPLRFFNPGEEEVEDENEEEVDGGDGARTSTKAAGAASPRSPTSPPPIQPRVYRRRWFMLAVFCLLSMTNASQWIQYAIIGNVVRDFYGVSYLAVDGLSLVYMMAYIPLIWPVTWLLDRHEGGLKVIGVMGASLNCAGAWLRYAGATPDTFGLAVLGQTFCSVGQVFILGMPAHVAATWFGVDQVSTACAIGVFGNQMGVALGFVLPPILVPNDGNVRENMLNMFLGMACITSALLFLIFTVYQDKPPVPPSRAKLGAQLSRTQRSYRQSIVILVKNTGFMLLVVTYGINVGSFYAISTLLNQLIVSEFEGLEAMAGIIGMTIVLTGLVGSAVTGIWLDKTRTYRGTTVVVYILSLLGLIGFTFTLKLGNIWGVFAISAFLGFFMTGYLPLGFELAAELTHPEPEGTSSGMLNASAQTFGIVFTLLMGLILGNFGTVAANLFLCGAILIGCILTMFIKSDLRRQEAERMHEFQALPTTEEARNKEAEAAGGELSTGEGDPEKAEMKPAAERNGCSNHLSDA